MYINQEERETWRPGSRTRSVQVRPTPNARNACGTQRSGNDLVRGWAGIVPRDTSQELQEARDTHET